MSSIALRRDKIAAILVVGVIGVLIAGLQPQLLGALAAEGRLSAMALGVLASLELLAMGIAAGGTGLVLGAASLRSLAAGALLVSGALDLLTPFLDGGAIFAARIGAGLAEGVLIWVAIGFIVRSAQPERWSGFYLAIQTVAQFAVAALLGLFVLAHAGSAGGFSLLGAVTLAGLLAVPWMPRAYPPLAPGNEGGGAPPARGFIALGGVLLSLAFIVAVWVYIEPVEHYRGVSAATAQLAEPLSLAMQVLGAVAATVLAERLAARATIAVVALANLIILATLAWGPVGAFLPATALFGFLWMFVLPFQIPLVIAADPTRRAAALIGGAQLTGSSLGPLTAAMLVNDVDPLPVLWFGAVCAAAGAAVLLAAARRPAQVEALA